MRVYALYLVIAAISLYAYRDWFKSTCGLILVMAFVQHPDFPNSIGGIQGLNPWNVGLANVVIAWIIGRRREGLVWDMPAYFRNLLLIYLAVVLVGWLRCVADASFVSANLIGDLISERLVNTIKWVIPGLLLFDGCRSAPRLRLALASVLGLYLLLGLQVIRWMPAGTSLTGASLNQRALKTILNEIGYHPVNMSMMLAGACWATLATLPLLYKHWQKAGVVLAALAIAYAQALTGGRMGYVTWGVVGLTMSVLRWRRYLLLAPLMALGISLAVPGAVERMLLGFGERTATDEVVTDDYEVTSGRTLIWPYVLEKIGQSPLIGYGRAGMDRTGLVARLWRELGESFPHPHNAYLEWLLDNGVLGFLLVMPFYVTLLWVSARLFCSASAPAYVAVGGACFALVLALLVAALGSQTFYPREGSVGMWAAIGLMLRLAVQQQYLRARPPARLAPLPGPAVTSWAGTGADADSLACAPVIQTSFGNSRPR
jgi:O-antigen ligase